MSRSIHRGVIHKHAAGMQPAEHAFLRRAGFGPFSESAHGWRLCPDVCGREEESASSADSSGESTGPASTGPSRVQNSRGLHPPKQSTNSTPCIRLNTHVANAALPASNPSTSAGSDAHDAARTAATSSSQIRSPMGTGITPQSTGWRHPCAISASRNTLGRCSRHLPGEFDCHRQACRPIKDTRFPTSPSKFSHR